MKTKKQNLSKVLVFIGTFAISGMFVGCAELQHSTNRAIDTYNYDSSSRTHSFECPCCHGSGKSATGNTATCPCCDGTGRAKVK